MGNFKSFLDETIPTIKTIAPDWDEVLAKTAEYQIPLSTAPIAKSTESVFYYPNDPHALKEERAMARDFRNYKIRLAFAKFMAGFKGFGFGIGIMAGRGGLRPYAYVNKRFR